MQNLTVLCEQSPLYVPAIGFYILISVPTNGWVLWLMISSPLFWTDRMDVFEFHLVLSEILFGFLEIPLIITFFYFDPDMINKMLTFTKTIIIIRNEFQSFVCMERYLAVIHPVLYLRYKLLRYRMSFCCVIWLQAILITALQMHFCCENEITKSICIVTFVYNFVVNSFCCLSVLRALKQPSPGEGEREGSNLIKKRAFNIVLMFQVITFLGYVPLITVFFLFGNTDQDMLCIWQPLTYCNMLCFGVIYPIFYLRRARKCLVINDLCVNCFLK